MASILVEQPPLNTDEQLAEYLSRVFNSVNTATQNSSKIDIIYVQPDKPQVGRLYYFGDAIAGDPDITQEGLYIYKSTGWTFIV